MHGFKGEQGQVTTAADQRATSSYSDVPWTEVQRLIARARSERAAYATDWIRRTFASWSSVFHGPGHILPREGGGRHLSTR